MGSYMNFKSLGDTPQPDGSGSKSAVNFPLARQSSIYSMTFDEFQNTMGGIGKDFGSMNMDELLKNIWTVEETQAMATFTGGSGTEGSIPGGILQRQSSFTLPLPRTLSQKTVDEVWRDLLKESGSAKDESDYRGSNLQQRQQTLGEMTLEEFLVKAGIVGDNTQAIGRANNGGFYGDISRPGNNNTGLTLGFQLTAQNNGILTNQTTKNNNLVPNQSPNLALNIGGVRSSQQQLQAPQHQQQQPPPFPKQATVAFASPMHLVNNSQVSNLGTKGAMVGMADPPMNGALVQGGVIQSGAMNMPGLSSGAAAIASVSPICQLSSDVKSNMNTASLSPVSYMFNEGTRGRKGNGPLEKVVERRHRRMIKNRESAARSRARKQAYTLELEAEVAKLKEINQELQKKQADIVEMQKTQILGPTKMPWISQRGCLRRTLTGPW